LISLLEHLAESTLIAVLLAMTALSMRRTGISAATRHKLWLLAMGKLAIPSFLLWFAGNALASRIAFRPPLQVRVADFSHLLNVGRATGTLAISTVQDGLLPILLGAVWLVGTLFAIASWMRRLRQFAMPMSLPSEAVERAFARARQRLFLRQLVRIRISEHAAEPVLMGLWHPVVVLPEALTCSLSENELEAVLLHELAHAVRRDNLTNSIAHVISLLFWFHPLLWWMKRQLSIECEYACDEVVLAKATVREDYISGIVKAARFALSGPVPGISGIAGFEFKKRLELIMSRHEKTVRTRTGRGLVGGAAIALLIIPLAAGFLSRGLLKAQSIERRHGVEFITAASTDNTPQSRQILAELKVLLNPNETIFPASNNRWDKWLNGDVAYLITPEEHSAFLALKSDQQREQFINQFWDKRNPQPGSPVNSFKEEHYRRIAFANQHLAVPEAAGWQTDRGRIYIVMGPPDEIDSHPDQNREMWRYRQGNITVQFDTSDRRQS